MVVPRPILALGAGATLLTLADMAIVAAKGVATVLGVATIAANAGFT